MFHVLTSTNSKHLPSDILKNVFSLGTTVSIGTKKIIMLSFAYI